MHFLKYFCLALSLPVTTYGFSLTVCLACCCAVSRSSTDALVQYPIITPAQTSMSPLMLDDHQSSERGKSKSSFSVVPAKPQDVRRLVDIEFHAFENERVNQVLSYRDYKKASHFARSVKSYQAALRNNGSTSRGVKRRRSGGLVGEPLQPSSTVQFRKVVDMQSQEIVSFTKYEMKKYDIEELLSPADIGHEGEPKMNRDWFALNERLRRQYIGLAEHCCMFDEKEV